MEIILYNVNSFGGNYEYSKQLFEAYQSHSQVSDVLLLSPGQPFKAKENILLLTDLPSYSNKILRKGYFIYRSLINPLRLYRFLKKRNSSIVIFNDFDQLTSVFWSRWFLKLKKQHVFAVMLHDPDRDQFLPLLSLSVASMKKVMRIMDIAFFHGYLPDKPYYRNNVLKVEVPHGIYPAETPSSVFIGEVNRKRRSKYLLAILGNIRDEKNYSFIIESLVGLPDCDLLIAGAKSSGDVPIEQYKDMIAKLGLQSRVIWIERFLDKDELNAAITVSDVILLYYKQSFTSQSGILNQIAPYQKKLIIADTPSALKQVAEKYQLGLLVAPNNMEAFVAAVNKINSLTNDAFDSPWKSYKTDASWKKHVEIAMENYKKIKEI